MDIPVGKNNNSKPSSPDQIKGSGRLFRRLANDAALHTFADIVVRGTSNTHMFTAMENLYFFVAGNISIHNFNKDLAIDIRVQTMHLQYSPIFLTQQWKVYLL